MATYLILDLIVLLLVGVGLYARHIALLRSRKLWLVAALLVVTTAIFDNILIAAGMFSYNPAKILGLHIGLAPIEDFFYPIIAALIVYRIAHASSPKEVAKDE